MDLTTYLAFRQRVWDYNPGDVERAATVRPPTDATDLALRVAYVILNGGMSWRIADGVWQRLAPRLREAGTVGEAFRHPRKRDAIDSIMANRTEHFASFRAAWASGPTATVAWCASLPHVGAVTKFHLAKNLGLDYAKPDVWLVRVAQARERPH